MFPIPRLISADIGNNKKNSINPIPKNEKTYLRIAQLRGAAISIERGGIQK
jgi:hypothetical protein